MATLPVLAEGLRKRYGPANALEGFDLAVPEGSVCGLLGPNGAGKTTAVRILATLLRPDGGRARVAGFDVVRQAAQVRYRIGLLGQHAAVDEVLGGRQNLVLFGRLHHLGAVAAGRRADELLERFGLGEVGGKPVKQYSGGMRRRLDLAASLILAPPVLFLDEPTTGLDPRGRNEVWEAVRALVAGGTTVLLTTQYLDEADQLADRISVIDHGRGRSPRGRPTSSSRGWAATGSTSWSTGPTSSPPPRPSSAGRPGPGPRPRPTPTPAGSASPSATGWPRSPRRPGRCGTPASPSRTSPCGAPPWTRCSSTSPATPPRPPTSDPSR